jgi:SAM-dependent methyltransferase
LSSQKKAKGMSTVYQKLRQEFANIKWKAEKRLRAVLQRDPKYLAAGLREALELISAKTKRFDWPKVSTRIDLRDMMYEGHPTAYFLSGYSALFCIRKALDKAGKKSVASILDFACGHGRVLRSLAADFPKARLVALDTNKAGVDFCAKVFGAKPVYSNIDFSNLSFDGKFDLIWVGSLFTHLRGERWPILMTFFVLFWRTTACYSSAPTGVTRNGDCETFKFSYLIYSRSVSPRYWRNTTPVALDIATTNRIQDMEFR